MLATPCTVVPGPPCVDFVPPVSSCVGRFYEMTCRCIPSLAGFDSRLRYIMLARALFKIRAHQDEPPRYGHNEARARAAPKALML